MANFFDAVTGEDIAKIEVKKGSKFKIGLYGGGPPPQYERLNVTTAEGTGNKLADKDPAVTFLKEVGSWRFLYEIDSNKMQGSSIRACINGGDYSKPAAVIYVTSKDTRKSIVTLARTFVSSAHYLWGTAGNEPGVANGNAGGGKTNAAKMRDYSLDPKATAQDKVLAVCTAVQPLFDGYNTCAGRSANSKETPDLDAYIKAREADIAKGIADQLKWEGAGTGKDLFPRKYYFRGAISEAGKVVWGESCARVRHFDCVGLVNYCYAKHWYKGAFGMDIAAFRNANAGTSQITNASDLMDADILIKPGNGHIAMLYQGGNNWYVVQASWSTTGLSDTDIFNAKSWDRFRMNDAFLVGMHGAT
jgi:hypothetical protein